MEAQLKDHQVQHNNSVFTNENTSSENILYK